MVVKVPMDKVVLAYVQGQLGTNPVKYNSKKNIQITLFSLFRRKTKADGSLPCGLHYLEVDLPDLFIQEGRTYISRDAVRVFEAAMKDVYENKLLDTIYDRRCIPGVKYKDAVTYALAKFGLPEEILPYQTMWKRVQRHRQRMETYGSSA